MAETAGVAPHAYKMRDTNSSSFLLLSESVPGDFLLLFQIWYSPILSACPEHTVLHPRPFFAVKVKKGTCATRCSGFCGTQIGEARDGALPAHSVGVSLPLPRKEAKVLGRE